MGELPEPIIHHVQSFLTAKQATQTSILSKSWHIAWLIRPNLDFDETDFRTDRPYFDSETDEFWKLAKKTIQRYKESNLKIESFRLSLDYYCHYRDYGIANELVVKALKIGATHLRLQLEYHDRRFLLPHEVFGAENLVELSVKGCKIDLGMDRTVRCSRLESLSLDSVEIERGIIRNIFSSCPLITKLSLSSIYYEVAVVRWVCSGDLINLQNLRCLLLCGVKIGTLFFGDLSSKFPSLKDLTLKRCRDEKGIRISSRSLERLNLIAVSGVEFDVPSIRKFTYEGSISPSLSFKSTSREWESHVSITHYDGQRLSTLWFLELNKFLTELSRSKIYLSLRIQSHESFDYEVEGFQGLPKPQVENLTMNMTCIPSLTCYALLDGLFRLCRPIFITQYLPPESSFCHKTNNEYFLCKTLVRGMNEKCSIQSLCMFGWHDLEEVNVQLFDEVGAVWRDLPWKSLLDASTSPEDKKKIRFQLKWKN